MISRQIMILYQALASKKLNQMKRYHACLNKLQDYGERHLYDQVEDDFFAVSLPDFLIFEDDLTEKNRAHCYYLMGLSKLGAGEYVAAENNFEKCVERLIIITRRADCIGRCAGNKCRF